MSCLSCFRPAPLPLVLLAALLGAAPVHAVPPAAPGAEGFAAFADDDSDEAPLVAVGDFDGDGIPDLVETTPSEGERPARQALTVLLGRADGSYTRVESRTLTGADPSALVAGDFDGDGRLDVILGDRDGAILEFRGDGRGHLAEAGEIAHVGSAVSIAAGRFTRDGRLDLAVSDEGSNSTQIFLGAGDGSFRPGWAFSLPQMGKEFRLTAADFNQDGVSDLVITSEEEGEYEVMLGDGNGTFTYAPRLSHLKDPNSYCPT